MSGVDSIVWMNWSHLVHAHFLIHGCTKNTCDHLFNPLMMEWRKKNVYTPNQLQHLLEGAPNCKCVCCNNGFLKDWSALQDKFWNAPIGETLNNHVLEVSSEYPTNMSVQFYCDGPQKNSCLKSQGQIWRILLICNLLNCQCLEYKT